MGIWYWFGVALGLGVALGTTFAALATPFRAGVLLACAAAVLGGFALGLTALGLVPAVGVASGGACGGFSAAELYRATIRRGGTRWATAFLLVLFGLGLGALALVPGLGYLEAITALALGLRLRRRAGSRFAGLRTLARD